MRIERLLPLAALALAGSAGIALAEAALPAARPLLLSPAVPLRLLSPPSASSAPPPPPPPPINEEALPAAPDPNLAPSPAAAYPAGKPHTEYQPVDDQGHDLGYGVQGGVSQFYDPLAPFGDWQRNPTYGYVWLPRDVRFGWRPYIEGHWVYTLDGWAWVSDEPWGWATYHYGRWLYDPSQGWEWVPGRRWAPAWVVWRGGGGYLGWAPLPPPATPNGWQAGGAGLDVGETGDLSTLNTLGASRSAIEPAAFCFVPERELLAPRVAEVVVPRARNVTLIRGTTNITNYTVVDNRVVNRGVPPERVEQLTGRRLEPLRIASAPAPTQDRERGGEVAFYRPLLQARAGKTLPFSPGSRSDAEGPGAANPSIPPNARLDGGQAPGKPVAGGELPSIPSAPPRQPVPQAAPSSQTPKGQRPQRPPGAPPPPAPPAPKAPRYTPEELSRRHQSQLQALQAYQQSERQRLQEVHQRELAGKQTQAARDAIRRQQAAELKAMQQQQQRELQALQARQQRERQAAARSPHPSR